MCCCVVVDVGKMYVWRVRDLTNGKPVSCFIGGGHLFEVDVGVAVFKDQAFFFVGVHGFKTQGGLTVETNPQFGFGVLPRHGLLVDVGFRLFQVFSQDPMDGD